MKKVIIFYSIVAILLICILPWTTPVKKTLNAVKLDAEGNELGTVQIQLEGKKRDYLFRTDRFDVDITPFDNFQSFGEVLNEKNVPDVIWKLDGEISYVRSGLSYKDELRPTASSLILAFNRKMDRFILFDMSEEFRYVASTKEEITSQELLEYFSELLEQTWFYKPETA